MSSIRRWGLIVGLAVASIALMTIAWSSLMPAERSAGELVVGVRRIPMPTNQGQDSCAGVGTDTRALLVSTPDGVVARLDFGGTIPIVWPVGFVAVYNPTFDRVLDASGRTFAVAGEDLSLHFDGNEWHGKFVCMQGGAIGIYP